MLSMTEDDAAYTALLTQLLSDSASTRNARVHSWIEHQYDFAFSEHPHQDGRDSYPPATSRAPSPSPSSSLGAHRTFSIDRPDSPLLPRFSSDRPVSPRSEPCPSYDALFFSPAPPPNPLTEDEELEEQERARALRFLVQEMAHWKLQNASATMLNSADKPLPAPPPSPASSLTQSSSSRAMRSRSSSMRISRLPSFTSTLSSDQSQPQDLPPPPLPISVIVHGEYQHALVLRPDPHVDSCFRNRSDSFPAMLSHTHDNEVHLLPPLPDDKDSAYPSPTLSNFSCAYSRETAFTTPYTSSPASPTSATFDSVCSPENIALPASPVEEVSFFGESLPTAVHERTPSFPGSFVSSSNTFPASPSLTSLAVSHPMNQRFPSSATSYFPAVTADGSAAQTQHLRAPKSPEHSQSRWSVATTASLTPSTAEPKTGAFLRPNTPPKGKKDKELKTPKKRTRFISLISRLSPGRVDTSATTTSSATADDVDYDSANESDNEDCKEKTKQKKSLSKKSSLASLRASFSISRASFSSQRPPLASPIEEVPPLPTSPIRASFNASRPSLTDAMATSEVVPPVPRISTSKIPSRTNSALPPIPQSASTITSFQTSSQVSIPETSVTSPSASRVSLVFSGASQNTSRVSLLPPSSKRTSLASAAGIEPTVSTSSMPASQTPNRSKSIFRLTTKPKSPRMPTTAGSPTKAVSSKLPVPGPSLPSPTSTSRIPQAPTKFTPPTKLATVLAAQSQKIPPSSASPPASKLPTLPSRTSSSKLTPRTPLTITVEKSSANSLPAPSTPTVSKLPMPTSTKGTRTGTVKGFWRRQ